MGAHLFSMRPYFFEIVAATIIVAVLLFVYLAFFRKSWLAMVPVLLVGLVMLFEASLGTPVVSGLIRRDAENIVVTITPEKPEQELILTAHYDSKTQPFDHQQRELIFQLIIPR